MTNIIIRVVCNCSYDAWASLALKVSAIDVPSGTANLLRSAASVKAVQHVRIAAPSSHELHRIAFFTTQGQDPLVLKLARPVRPSIQRPKHKHKQSNQSRLGLVLAVRPLNAKGDCRERWLALSGC